VFSVQHHPSTASRSSTSITWHQRPGPGQNKSSSHG
jgi:hypothetical protein